MIKSSIESTIKSRKRKTVAALFRFVLESVGPSVPRDGAQAHLPARHAGRAGDALADTDEARDVLGRDRGRRLRRLPRLHVVLL